MRGFGVGGAIFPPQHLPSHLVRRTQFSCSAILLLILTVIYKSKPQPANKTSNKKGTRNDKEMRIQTQTRPKNPQYTTFHRSLLHSYSVPFAVSADCPKPCPPRSYLHPGLMKWCSRSSTMASTLYPLLQPSRPGLTRRCSLSRVLRAHTVILV